MSRIPMRVETARTIAERPRTADAEPLARILGDPEVARWLWPGDRGGPTTPARAAEMLDADIADWERRGWGPWIVRDRATGEVVGRAGLRSNVVEGRRVVELAWLIASGRWGEGLAAEVGREAVRAAFDRLRLDELVAVTLTGNFASQAVMRKLGMVIEREVEHAGLPHVLARLSRPRAPAGRPR